MARRLGLASEDGHSIVLALNPGSSSLKYDLLTPDGASLGDGIVERIGEPGGCPDHANAVRLAFGDLTRRVPDWTNRVRAVGYRVVHGGPDLWRPTRVDESCLAYLERYQSLAPLHTPIALQVIRAALKRMTAVPHVAVFDTGFHHDLPTVARAYAIPTDLADRYAIRRYGFHGISCEYLVGRLTELAPARRRVILCHLGAGASITAVRDGHSVDTSMGFTPLEGLVMATRSGDIDPAVSFFLQEHAGMSLNQVRQLLERNAGLKGVSGASGDFREIEDRAGQGDERARLAFDLFAYRVRKYIGAYFAVLGGIDALVFAGGIGEHSAALRSTVIEPLAALGLRLDRPANNTGPPERQISPPDAATTIWVIPTNESLAVARHALALALHQERQHG